MKEAEFIEWKDTAAPVAIEQAEIVQFSFQEPPKIFSF